MTENQNQAVEVNETVDNVEAVNANSNMKIWHHAETTPPEMTKSFKRAGGFSGTSINQIYLAQKATEIFGPCGINWGYEIVDEKIVDGVSENQNGFVRLNPRVDGAFLCPGDNMDAGLFVQSQSPC